MTLSEILGSLKRSFGMVLTFSGRDHRSQFWPLPIFLFLANGLILQIYMGIKIFPGNFVQNLTGRGINELFQDLLLVNALLAIVSIILVSAAVVRRLHDRGKAGWWALPPLPFLVIGLVIFPPVFDQIINTSKTNLFAPLLANNLVYLMLLGFLCVQLARKGDEGANRFGPPPKKN